MNNFATKIKYNYFEYVLIIQSTNIVIEIKKFSCKFLKFKKDDTQLFKLRDDLIQFDNNLLNLLNINTSYNQVLKNYLSNARHDLMTKLIKLCTLIKESNGKNLDLILLNIEFKKNTYESKDAVYRDLTENDYTLVSNFVLITELLKLGYKFKLNSVLEKKYYQLKQIIDKIQYTPDDFKKIAEERKGIWSKILDKRMKHENKL